jgi:hypothetical protein
MGVSILIGPAMFFMLVAFCAKYRVSPLDRPREGSMPQPPECWTCGELELRIVRAPYPADDMHLYRCPYCRFVAKALPLRTERDKSR